MNKINFAKRRKQLTNEFHRLVLENENIALFKRIASESIHGISESQLSALLYKLALEAKLNKRSLTTLIDLIDQHKISNPSGHPNREIFTTLGWISDGVNDEGLKKFIKEYMNEYAGGQGDWGIVDLGGGYTKDGKHIYYNERVIENADYNSFEVLEGYAKDKDHIYIGDRIMPDADITSFHMLGRNYYIDRNSVYYDGKKIVIGNTPADPKTFERIGESDYYRDKHFVYYQGKRLNDSDVETFQVLEEWPYCRDKNHVYFQGHPIDFIDINTFRILNGNRAIDKNHVYRLYYELQWVPEDFKTLIDDRFDPATFELLDGWHVKDKSAVYYGDIEIPEADPETFHLLENGYAEDKNHRYKYGKIIQ